MRPNGIGEPVDRKFKFLAVSTEHDHPYDEDHGVLFLAKDRLLPETLRVYLELCRERGVDQRQIAGVELLIERVARYQAANPALLKLPDVSPGPEGDVIVADNAGR